MFFSVKAESYTNRGKRVLQRLQRLFIIALFGAIIFVGNLFLPPPLNYLMMVVQAVFLALASLFIHKVGAMYVGAIGGLLTGLASPSLGPFTFLFAFLYGVYVDVFMALFRVRGTRQGVNANRVMAVMTLSTLLIAVTSYSAFAVFPDFFAAQGLWYTSFFVQRSLMLDMLVLFMGPATGVCAGYASAYLWNKYLRHMAV